MNGVDEKARASWACHEGFTRYYNHTQIIRKISKNEVKKMKY